MSAAERRRSGRASTELDRDSGATLKTAALQDEAARSGSHPLDEPVHALAAAFLWLVRSLRHNLGTLRYLGAGVNKGLRNPQFRPHTGSVLSPVCPQLSTWLSTTAVSVVRVNLCISIEEVAYQRWALWKRLMLSMMVLSV